MRFRGEYIERQMMKGQVYLRAVLTGFLALSILPSISYGQAWWNKNTVNNPIQENVQGRNNPPTGSSLSDVPWWEQSLKTGKKNNFVVTNSRPAPSSNRTDIERANNPGSTSTGNVSKSGVWWK
jgi:hypothetical protein